MDILISNSSNEPIYSQIYAQIKAQIMDGRLKEGDPLPSMRNLALHGFIESYTGRGSFVKAQNAELMREEHLRETEALLSQACEKAKLAGMTLDEMKDVLDMIYGEG